VREDKKEKKNSNTRRFATRGDRSQWVPSVQLVGRELAERRRRGGQCLREGKRVIPLLYKKEMGKPKQPVVILSWGRGGRVYEKKKKGQISIITKRKRQREASGEARQKKKDIKGL